MKQELALRLLGNLMKWELEEANKEFKWLRLLVDYKYDHYQGYSPGARFLVNLINWLNQFSSIEDRKAAYRFIREKLIFISQREMQHLIGLTMPYFETEARRLVATKLNLKFYETWAHHDAEKKLRLLKLRTLYVALSDGAHIDVFRRENEGAISNEQVVPLAEISPQKWQNITDKLRKRLDTEKFNSEDAKFERICLIDDFTGSGYTLIRCESGTWDGKIPKFCGQCRDNDILGKHISNKCTLHIHHYLASAKAKETIVQELGRYDHESFSFVTTFSYWLPPDIVVNSTHNDKELLRWITDNYDSSVETKHTGKDIWYGYRQGGLTLVLDHNTPNNSIALLWAKSKEKEDATSATRMQPLFHRKERHIDHGKN